MVPAALATTVHVDNQTPDATPTGTWLPATGATAHYGTVSDYASSTGSGANAMVYAPSLPNAGTYRVEAWNSCFPGRGVNVPHEIVHDGGSSVVAVDQSTASGSCGQWEVLGEYPFTAGTAGSVTISDAGVTADYVGADAVRFVRLSTLAIEHVSDDGSTVAINASGLSAGQQLTVSMSCADPPRSCVAPLI